MKRAAPGRCRGSVAHPAACWEQDTIPKPDGLAGPLRGPEIERRSNATRTLSGLSGSRSSRVRRRYRPADQRRASCWRIIESSTCWTTFLDSGSNLETASNWSLRASSGPRSSLPNKQLIGTDAEGHRHVADDIEGGLRDARLVSF